ncbi:uncharacterized protein [Struthio camelus]|uniref:uncharacterized protein n=1 Tax=Struthio camelus TaxID=8801 RepID=UPI003603DC62
MGSAKLALTLLAAALLLPAAATLKIGAFNIRTFGDSKMSNKTIVGIIVTIVLEYDIILVQEVRDTDLSAVKNLMDQLNSVLPHPYTFLVSKPLGQSTYKEQYLFIYKLDMVSVLESYYYDNSRAGIFSREPFIVKLSSPHTPVEEFVLVPLHADPDNAAAEIDALYDVYADVVSKWATNDILFLGDFNAACSYVAPSAWPTIRLRALEACEWLVPEGADTTVTLTRCTYDRMVACGSALTAAVQPGSAAVNNFQQIFHLQYRDALAVSDHFPVEVTLKCIAQPRPGPFPSSSMVRSYKPAGDGTGSERLGGRDLGTGLLAPVCPKWIFFCSIPKPGAVSQAQSNAPGRSVGMQRLWPRPRGSASLRGRAGTAPLALSLLAAALLPPAAAALRIGAFNIQAFGDSKMSDQLVAGVLVEILSRYDVALVQEVRDSDLSAVTQLLEQLNSASMSPYAYEISGPLGRENYKEMYLFIYRTEVVSVVDTYQYEDPQDVFSREPFILRVSSPHTKAEEFVLVPLHSAPHAATAEIDALYDVYLAIVSKWDTDNIIFLGDFNADCSYVRPGDWSYIRLRTSNVFKWLLPDSADTTVGKSDCAYDRIVVCGSKLKRSIVPNSATVYNFQRAFQLEQEEALAVSDHFPVEVKLAA